MHAIEDFYTLGRLARFSFNNTSANVEGLSRLRDKNINAGCFSAFAGFDGARLGRIAHVWMESLGIIDTSRDRRSHPFRLRISRADQITPLRHSDNAIDSLLISHLNSGMVEGVRLRFPVVP